MGWDGMGWDGMGWDGMGWDGMGWDGTDRQTDRQTVRSVFGSVPCSCFHVFNLEFSHGSRLCLASLALMSLCYWFPCSLCHVLIGLFMSCDPLCLYK